MAEPGSLWRANSQVNWRVAPPSGCGSSFASLSQSAGA